MKHFIRSGLVTAGFLAFGGAVLPATGSFTSLAGFVLLFALVGRDRLIGRFGEGALVFGGANLAIAVIQLDQVSWALAIVLIVVGWLCETGGGRS